MKEDFEIWWHNEGSGMPPFKEEETCDHVKRLSAIAWSNGAFKATLSLEAENARLKAEVERLKEEYIDATNHYNKLHNDLQAEVERLRASSFVTAVPVEQYERVIKAGDALHKSMLEVGPNDMADEFDHDRWWASYYGWNAAKEGKQP